ncbi:MAG TPA: hypothetical protein VI504_12820, partial [Candidatus Eisenbacteria bacterium]
AGLAPGALVPLAVALALFASQGALALAWWTWVVYPAEVMGRLHGMPVRNLVATGRWLLGAWPPLLVPAAIGAGAVLRDRADRHGRALLAWIAAGIVVFLLQRWSGWEYQMFLVLVPLGLLAARGLEALAASISRRWPGGRPAAVGAGALLLGVGITFAGAIGRSDEVVASGSLVDPAAARELLARRSGGAYAHFARLTEFLRAPDAEPGPIYVLGNPLAYWISGRAPALAMPGGMSIYTAHEWATIARELAAARPPYLLIEDPMAAALAERSDIARPFLDALERYYRPAARMGSARWFVRIP